jgi:hypothetical protein
LNRSFSNPLDQAREHTYLVHGRYPERDRWQECQRRSYFLLQYHVHVSLLCLISVSPFQQAIKSSPYLENSIMHSNMSTSGYTIIRLVWLAGTITKHSACSRSVIPCHRKIIMRCSYHCHVLIVVLREILVRKLEFAMRDRGGCAGIAYTNAGTRIKQGIKQETMTFYNMMQYSRHYSAGRKPSIKTTKRCQHV